MSNRTAESNKAVVEAWEREQQLVREGKGTRDWTPQQQQDILERGKVYDDDGRAYEGHHMRSVMSSPEEQGNPDNIQLLSREEHKEAHGIGWQPTNGYFDPVTKQKVDFGDGPIVPCSTIQLSEPIVPHNLSLETEDSIPDRDKTDDHPVQESKSEPTITPGRKLSKIAKNIGSTAKKVLVRAYEFSQQHHVLTSIAVNVAIPTLQAALRKNSSGRHINSQSSKKNQGLSVIKESAVKNTISIDVPTETPSIIDFIEKQPYTPNYVPPGFQHYHYKDGSVRLKQKTGYHRGGK